MLYSVQEDLLDSPNNSFNPPAEPIATGANLHKYLVAYVNQELFLDPPIPNRGKALFDTCSDPTALWSVNSISVLLFVYSSYFLYQ